MESRLVLFLFFLMLTVGALSLGGYKKYFNKSREISLSSITSAKKAKAKTDKPSEAEEEKEEIAEPKAVELSTDQLKRAHAIYTGAGECIRCHGEFGQGNPKEEAPLIAGQHDWYIIDQLVRMKKGERVNVKMQPFIKKLSENDFEDLAAYITLLRAGKKAQ